jgi:hypothetical protein
MSIRFGEKAQIIPVGIPHDLVNAEHRTTYVDLNLANWVTFVAQFGAVTSGSTSDTLLISVEASSIETSAGATKIPFSYRLTNAVATGGMLSTSDGAISAGTSDGVSFSTSDLVNSALIVDVDPAILPPRGEKYRFVTFVTTPGSSLAVTMGATAYLEMRYSQNSMPSSS